MRLFVTETDLVCDFRLEFEDAGAFPLRRGRRLRNGRRAAFLCGRAKRGARVFESRLFLRRRRVALRNRQPAKWQPGPRRVPSGRYAHESRR